MTATISFLTPVQDEIHAVEVLMRQQTEGYHADLSAAMDLLVLAGGKRIRPALTILAGKLLGAPTRRLIAMATAVELLHTATLVHDDLIDSSLLRRGMPTLNAKWSPGATVLTGDFIFARAANLAAETDSVPVMKLFSQTLTVIVNGELVQLLGSKCLADRDNYFERIYAKTASLFETSAVSAGLIANAGPEAIEALRCYGREIGTAFQIIDDLLDFTGDSATVGKPLGSDLRQGIITLPVLHYLNDHPRDALTMPLRAGKCLPDAQIDELLAAIRTSDAIIKSHAEATALVARGLESVRRLPNGPERCALEELAQYIVERQL